MHKEYYALVAGLRQYALNAENRGFDVREIVADIRAGISVRDRKYLELFLMFHDVGNVINALAGRSRFSILGNFSHEELTRELKSPDRLPHFVKSALAAYNDPDNSGDFFDSEYGETERVGTIGKALLGAYYRECARSKCRFIRQWYDFDRNLRNFTTALTARRLGIPVADELVGDGEIVEVLSRNTAPDSGLRSELEYIDKIMTAVTEGRGLLEKEYLEDLVRWEMTDELTESDYFNINVILAYLAKVSLIHRWHTLDPGTGREMFRKLMADMDGPRPFDRPAG